MFGNSSQNYEGSAVAVENPRPAQTVRKQNQGGKTVSQLESILKKIQSFRVEFGPSSRDILNFTNQLAIMVRAGISIQDSLEAIAAQIANRRFVAIISDLKDRIEAGRSFSQALAEHPKVFGSFYVNIVAAAEVSGSLSAMLQKLAAYLDQEAETRSQIKGAMIYPIIIAVMAVAVTIFLLCFVLPRFTAIFAGKEHLLPMPTKILLASSAFLRGYWIFIVLGVGGVVTGLWYFITTDIGRFWWDKTKLVLPLIKTLCRSLYITRSLHTMGVLMKAGVPVLNTISITAQISGNVLYRDMWLGAYQQVRQGKKIANSLVRYELLPSNVVQMIRTGEESGTLSEVLEDVSDYYARELKTVIKTTVSMIEPIMIVLMGILVGFIAMSIILPIFKMSSVVAGK